MADDEKKAGRIEFVQQPSISVVAQSLCSKFEVHPEELLSLALRTLYWISEQEDKGGAFGAVVEIDGEKVFNRLVLMDSGAQSSVCSNLSPSTNTPQ